MTKLSRIYPHQVECLMRQFGMGRDELLHELNKGRKRKLVAQDVFAERIKYSTVKALDRVFCQGLSIYFDGADYDQEPQQSILFRKPAWLNRLRLPDKQVVAIMEGRAAELDYRRWHHDIVIHETLQKYTLDTPPTVASAQTRLALSPSSQATDKEFLVHLIDLLARRGIVVMEHLDLSIKKDRQTRLAGFYIRPSYIVIVRNMLSFKSEVFTLLHELGHYLLQQEGIDIDRDQYDNQHEDFFLSAEERWCDEFAFSFLVGDRPDFKELTPDQTTRINKLSDELHLSKLAIYRHLCDLGKLSPKAYRNKRRAIIRASVNKYKGKFGAAGPVGSPSSENKLPIYQVPIFSDLERHIFAEAYRDEAISLHEILLHFRTNKPEDIFHAW